MLCKVAVLILGLIGLVGLATSQTGCPTDVEVSYTTTTARVTWNTAPGQNGLLSYGVASTLGTDVDVPGPLTSFTVDIPGLTTGTLYYYLVNTYNNTNSCNGTLSTFTTLDVCSISGVVATPTDETATISWVSAPAMAYGHVAYGLTSTYDLFSPIVTSPTVVLTGLTPNTTYHYQIVNTDINTQECTTVDATFTTDLPLPCVVPAFTVLTTTSSTISLSWTTDKSSTCIVSYGPTISLGSATGPIGPATSFSTTLTGLNPATVYYYQINCTDVNTNDCGTSIATNVTTADVCVILEITVSGLTDVSVVISWSTTVPTSGVFEYGLTDSYGTTVTLATATAFVVPLTALVANTTYHYRITMTGAGGICQSIDYTLTTSNQCFNFVTYSQGDYAKSCSNGNANCILLKYFDGCFDSDAWVGCPAKFGGKQLQFTTGAFAARFLPKLNPPGTLSVSALNPLNSTSGTDGAFAGEVLTAMLNIMFDQCVPTGGCATPLGSLCYSQSDTSASDYPCNGYVISDIKAASLFVLGGCTTLSCTKYVSAAPALCSLNSTTLNACLVGFNNNFRTSSGPLVTYCP